MEPPFAAYIGHEPYVFVSYAHSDASLVYPELSSFHEAQVKIWYDEGIEPGTEWRDEIADAITRARLFLYFVTGSSIQSEHCKREVNFAIDQAIPVVLIYLEPVELAGGLRLTLADRQAINKYEISRVAYEDRITRAFNKHLEGSVENLTAPARGRLTILKKTLLGFLVLAVVFGTLFSIPTSRAWIFDQSLNVAVTVNSRWFREMEVRPGIAVLPFVNLSGDPSDEYFSDGISEEILNDLSRSRRLPVIARTSSFQFKGTDKSVGEIGEILGITHIIEGSVRRFDNNVRITARLVDAQSGLDLWSNSYNSELANFFEVQSEISTEILAQIDELLGQAEKLHKVPQGFTIKRSTSNIEAYDLYLKGLQASTSNSPIEIEKAIPLFERAIAVDVEYADAWALLGSTYVYLAAATMGKRIGAEVYPTAINAFRQALSIDPNHAMAMANLGYVLILYEYDWRNGIELIEAAVALDPQNPVILMLYGHVLIVTRQESAEKIIEQAYRLDPLTPNNIFLRASGFLGRGQIVKGLSLMETALIANSKSYTANYLVAMFHAGSGRLPMAEKHLDQARLIVGPEYPPLKVLEYLVARRQGDQVTAERIKGEIYTLIQTERVPGIFAVEWNQEEFKVILENRLQQRDDSSLGLFLGNRPGSAPEVQWKEYQSRVRFSEADIGTLSMNPNQRNQKEQDRLLSEAIFLTEEQLGLYVGSYRRENDGGVRRMLLEEGRLLYTWPNGNFLYLVPTGLHEFKTLGERITVNFGVSNTGSDTMTILLEAQGRTIVAVKVDEQ